MIVVRNTDDQQLSKHFLAKEFRCHCGKCNVTLISKRTIFYLESLRKLMDSPLRITSGYRCQEYNRDLVGSAVYSWHMSGHAVDISLPEEEKHRQLLLQYAAMLFPYHYVGEGFVHLDTRGSQ